MKRKMRTKWMGMAVLVCMVLFTFMATVVPAQAATPNLSGSKYIKTYPLSNGNNTPVYTSESLGTRGTSSPYRAYNATIYASDEIYVYSMTGSYSYISYPTSSGRRYGYIRTSDITPNNYSVDARTSRAGITTYRRAGSTQYGSVYAGDTVYTVAKSGNYVQIIYPAGSVYKMAWITQNHYNSYIADQAQQQSSTNIADGDYYVKCAQNNNYAWDIDGAFQTVGANLMIYQAHGGNNQVFNFKRESDGCYTIKAKHSGQVLDVLGDGRSAGSNIVQSVSHGGNNQRWKVVKNSDGTYSFVSKSNGLYIDVQNNSMSNGANVQCWLGNGSNAQKFKLESASGRSTNSSSTGLASPVPSGCKFTRKTSDGGWYGFHDININVSSSTPVYAIADGTVIFHQAYRVYSGIPYLTSYGNYILFTSSDNVFTAKYCHLSGFNGVAQRISSANTRRVSGSTGTYTLATRNVRKGELLGYIGMTGNATGVHLHFELFKNGSRIDPTSMISGLN